MRHAKALSLDGSNAKFIGIRSLPALACLARDVLFRRALCDRHKAKAEIRKGELT